jgi:hypothetical protein
MGWGWSRKLDFINVLSNMLIMREKNINKISKTESIINESFSALILLMN